MSIVELRVRASLFAFMFIVSLSYTVTASNYQQLARYAPQFAGILATTCFGLLTTREVIRLLRVRSGGPRSFARTIEYGEEGELTVEALRSAAFYASCIFGYVALIWLIGMKSGSSLFLLAMLAMNKTRLRIIIGSLLGLLLFFVIFDRIGLAWYSGQLEMPTFLAQTIVL